MTASCTTPPHPLALHIHPSQWLNLTLPTACLFTSHCLPFHFPLLTPPHHPHQHCHLPTYGNTHSSTPAAHPLQHPHQLTHAPTYPPTLTHAHTTSTARSPTSCAHLQTNLWTQTTHSPPTLSHTHSRTCHQHYQYICMCQ